MAKNRFSLNTKNQFSTPSSAPNTINVVEHSPFNMLDDEEGDICPVCDGECTCNNKPRVPPPGPLSMAQLKALHLSSPPPPPAQKHPKPSLKIKLTVPQSLLGKRRNSNHSKMSGSANHLPDHHIVAADSSDAESISEKQHICPPHTSYTQPVHHYPLHQKHHLSSKQRKGRPPKQVSAAIPTARQLSLSQTPRTSPLADVPSHATRTSQPQKKKHLSSTKKTQKKQNPPRRLPAPLVKKKPAAATKRRRLACSGDSSPLSDVDHRFGTSDGEYDNESGQFPTFVSASILSSRASSSSAEEDEDDDSSLLSSFSDSSIEAEEEKFIKSEMQHDRARVKRELFGDEGARKRDSSWIIQPRKKSVGPSDVEMDVDSDATEDDDEAHEHQANADDECDEDDEETDEQRRRYIGLGTGWSDDEDEESSFDADLFFANLTGSGSDSSRSSAARDEDSDGEDGDQSDMESMSASITSLTGPNFELTEGWDGQIMFTNGLRDGQGILDMDFEARAAQYAESSPPASQEVVTASSDVEMNSVADDDDDDGGYERDTGEGEGDTTDEELVGEDELPNERAMRLFSLPLSVSAINPVFTMSPVASPGTRGRHQALSLHSHMKYLESPKPADILSGKIFWEGSDEFDDFEDSTVRSRSLSSSGQGGPRRGTFEVIREVRQAVIDDSHQDIPSPHPRFRRRRTSSLMQFNSIEHVLQQHARTLTHSPSVSISSQAPIATPPSASEEMESETPGTEHAELVDLNELLEASFMAPDPSSDSPTTSTENESRRAAQTLNRWDVVSVGAFRQSRESGMADVTLTPGGWTSDTTGSKHNTDYGSMMKSSPLSAMLWNNKNNRVNNRSRRPNIIISPILFPLKDGDRTPTNVPHHHQQQTPPNQNRYHPHKSRKELKKERKLKRKNFGNHPPHYLHHNHHHHSNTKTRSSSSTQRNNSFTSIPPLSI